MRTGLFLADRTAVLFLGVAAGAAIGYAFAPGGKAPPPPAAVSPAAAGRPASGSPAVASTKPDIAQECAVPFQPHLLKAVEAGEPVTVGVFGDSFGDGVWSALYRLLPAKEKYRVLKFSQQSTGFTRYATRNVEQHAEAQIAAEGPIDVAVVSFGANDTQGVYADGHAAALMSPEWQRVIGGRVDEFVRMMRSRGAIVYWLGLPKMRAAAFDADIAAMNTFYEQRMRALQVPFIDIRPLTVDAAGEYAPYLPDAGSSEPRLMRANDGIHMTMNGYVTITRALAGRIKAYIAAAHVMAGAVPPVAPPVVVPPPAPAKETETPRKLRSTEPKPKAKPRAQTTEPRATDAAEPSTAKPKAPAETPSPSRPKADAPATKPKVDSEASPKPRPDAVAQPKPKADVIPAAKAKAETPATSAKPKAEPSTAKPKVESVPIVRSQAETKPKSDVKPPAKSSSDKPAAKPATTSKPSSSSQTRPPLQLNLPPPEESRRSPSAPPTTDRP